MAIRSLKKGSFRENICSLEPAYAYMTNRCKYFSEDYFYRTRIDALLAYQRAYDLLESGFPVNDCNDDGSPDLPLDPVPVSVNEVRLPPLLWEKDSVLMVNHTDNFQTSGRLIDEPIGDAFNFVNIDSLVDFPLLPSFWTSLII